MSTTPKNHAKRRPKRRPRSRRGEGAQLRDEIVEVATRLLADLGDVNLLSLRAVAREVGIATTSIYLHFADIEELAAEVMRRAFAASDAARDAASEQIADPGTALLARSRAYCRFAVENPGLYQVMFGAVVPESQTLPSPEAPGRQSFQSLVTSIERCQRSGQCVKADPERQAVLLWAALHGLVSLRISRPRFAWTELDDQVAYALERIAGLSLGREAAQRSG